MPVPKWAISAIILFKWFKSGPLKLWNIYIKKKEKKERKWHPKITAVIHQYLYLSFKRNAQFNKATT